jgi:hypothetical protein
MGLKMLTIGVLAGVVSTLNQASERVEINWHQPETYSDVKPTHQSRQKFRDQVFKRLTTHVNTLSESLPEGLSLKLNVTNLDLAGRVVPASFAGLRGGSDIRLIKRVDIPRMVFSYQLSDDKKQSIKDGHVDLKALGFLDRQHGYFDTDTLKYEKDMLKRWFDSEFEAFKG